MSSLSIVDTVRASFAFSLRNSAEILKRILLPAISGGVILYILALAYINELDRFLVDHDQRSASLVLALAGGGFLALLFLHAIVATAVISLVFEKPRDAAWRYFHIALPEWRVYAGLLRLVVVAGILIVGGQGVRILLLRFGYDPLRGYMGQLLIFLVLIWIVIRIGFFVGPVGVHRTSGQIVGRSWEVSSTEFWRLLVIGLICILPGVFFYLLGEYVLRAAGMVHLSGSIHTLAELTGALHQMLFRLVLLLSLTYVICAVALSAATAFAYRTLLAGTADAV